jgi:DeoR family fructose operon transcriptional repressor
VRSARRTVVLADHTKIGRADFVRVASIEAIDLLITDSGIERELAEEISAAGVEVQTA